MNPDTIDILKGFGQEGIVLIVVLSTIAVCLGVIISVLREIKDELKNLVAETAYLATIEDDDETEGEEK